MRGIRATIGRLRAVTARTTMRVTSMAWAGPEVVAWKKIEVTAAEPIVDASCGIELNEPLALPTTNTPDPIRHRPRKFRRDLPALSGSPTSGPVSRSPLPGRMSGPRELGRAEAQRIRSDVDARDVIILISYLSRLDEAEWDTRARHLLDIVLNGLRRRE